MVSSVVYAGRWRVNNFSHSSRVSKPSTCHPHPGQNTNRHRSERGWPSAIIWNQRGGHCPPFVFQAALWGFSLEVFVLSLLYSWLFMETKVGFFPLLNNSEGQRVSTQTDGVFITERDFLTRVCPKIVASTPLLSPGTSIWLTLSPVQSPLTCQQPFNPIQYALLQTVVLMA